MSGKCNGLNPVEKQCNLVATAVPANGQSGLGPILRAIVTLYCPTCEYAASKCTFLPIKFTCKLLPKQYQFLLNLLEIFTSIENIWMENFNRIIFGIRFVKVQEPMHPVWGKQYNATHCARAVQCLTAAYQFWCSKAAWAHVIKQLGMAGLRTSSHGWAALIPVCQLVLSMMGHTRLPNTQQFCCT